MKELSTLNWNDMMLYNIDLIRRNYDYSTGLLNTIEQKIIENVIKCKEDIFNYIDEYITEEDEFLLGPINLQCMIEERDWTRRVMQEFAI